MDIYASSPIFSMDLYMLCMSSKDLKAFLFLVKALAFSIILISPNNLGRFFISSNPPLNTLNLFHLKIF